MTTAFVLIKTDIGSENEVLKSLKEIPEVKEAYSVYGVYDIVARVETDTMEEQNLVTSMKIRRIEKVHSTLTMIAV